MKKLALAAAAFMTAAAPIMTATPAAAYDRDRDRGDWRDRRDRDHDRRDRWDRDDRRDHRRHHRRERWERRSHNGYYYRDRFFYGPPPGHYYNDPYYRPGYRAWRRGERLPPYYRSRFVVVRDYDHYHLRRPPRGYHWVRDDRGEYLLVGIATGIILGLAFGSSGY
jgi:Ni/Co efflux regulator RcnB